MHAQFNNADLTSAMESFVQSKGEEEIVLPYAGEQQYCARFQELCHYADNVVDKIAPAVRKKKPVVEYQDGGATTIIRSPKKPTAKQSAEISAAWSGIHRRMY